MKLFSKFKFIAVVLFTAVMVTSCSNEEVGEVTPVNQDVNEDLNKVTAGDADFSLFRESIEIAGFKVEAETNNESRTNNNFGFTFFAPTNEAFRTFLAENGFTSLSQVPPSVLKDVLDNHLVKGKFLSTNLQTGYLKTFSTAGAATSNSTLSLFVDTSNGVKLNGMSRVVQANIRLGFLVVHKVDKVIPLPTIVTHATSNPVFSSLVGALTSPGQPNFVSVLSGTGPFTVFAPTNAAFTSLNNELAGGIASVSAANLTKVLQYHVVSGNILASSLSNNLQVNTLLTQNFTVNLPPPTIKDANGRVSNIVKTDVQCTNGVVHVLDKVLLPTL